MPTPSHHARVRRAGAPAAPAVTALAAAATLAAVAGGVAACGRDAPAPPAAAAPPPVAPPAPATAPVPAPAPTVATGWDAAAGAALLVPGPADDALLVVPGAADSAGVDTARAAEPPPLPADALLLGPGGMVGRARLAAVDGAAPGAPCAAGPRVRVGPASGADAVPAWTVGLVTGRGRGPEPLALRALDAPGADSAALAASLTRLAAALPEAPGVRPATRAALRGVPFRVRQMRGFAPDSATQAVVAVLTRTMNQEAAPAADAVLLVAERPAAAGADAWRTAFAERTTGPEEQLPASAVLAAVRLPGPRAALVTAREGDDGTRYALLERVTPGAWRPRWTSAPSRPGCGR